MIGLQNVEWRAKMNYKLPEAELKLAECIWGQGEMTSTEVVKLCESTFQWKKSTTYTLLKRWGEWFRI